MAPFDYPRLFVRATVILTGLVLVLALAATSWGRQQIQLSTTRQLASLTELYFSDQSSADCARVKFFIRAAPGSHRNPQPVKFSVVALGPDSSITQAGPRLPDGSVQLSGHDPYLVDITLPDRPRWGIQIRLTGSDTYIQHSCQGQNSLSSKRKS